jgi:hypothetical protein
MNPSVWRRGRLNTQASVRAVSMARSEYRGWPPRILRRGACHPANASGVTHNVRLPRRRRPASYSRQFVTLNFILPMRWRRAALCLNGMARIRLIAIQQAYFQTIEKGSMHQSLVTSLVCFCAVFRFYPATYQRPQGSVCYSNVLHLRPVIRNTSAIAPLNTPRTVTSFHQQTSEHLRAVTVISASDRIGANQSKNLSPGGWLSAREHEGKNNAHSVRGHPPG